MAGHGEDTALIARRGRAVCAWLGKGSGCRAPAARPRQIARRGMARPGAAWLGVAWPGEAGQGMDIYYRTHRSAGHGMTVLGRAGHGEAGQG